MCQAIRLTHAQCPHTSIHSGACPAFPRCRNVRRPLTLAATTAVCADCDERAAAARRLWSWHDLMLRSARDSYLEEKRRILGVGLGVTTPDPNNSQDSGEPDYEDQEFDDGYDHEEVGNGLQFSDSRGYYIGDRTSSARDLAPAVSYPQTDTLTGPFDAIVDTGDSRVNRDMVVHRKRKAWANEHNSSSIFSTATSSTTRAAMTTSWYVEDDEIPEKIVESLPGPQQQQHQHEQLQTRHSPIQRPAPAQVVLPTASSAASTPAAVIPPPAQQLAVDHVTQKIEWQTLPSSVWESNTNDQDNNKNSINSDPGELRPIIAEQPMQKTEQLASYRAPNERPSRRERPRTSYFDFAVNPTSAAPDLNNKDAIDDVDVATLALATEANINEAGKRNNSIRRGRRLPRGRDVLAGEYWDGRRVAVRNEEDGNVDNEDGDDANLRFHLDEKPSAGSFNCGFPSGLDQGVAVQPTLRGGGWSSGSSISSSSSGSSGSSIEVMNFNDISPRRAPLPSEQDSTKHRQWHAKPRKEEEGTRKKLEGHPGKSFQCDRAKKANTVGYSLNLCDSDLAGMLAENGQRARLKRRRQRAKSSVDLGQQVNIKSVRVGVF